jgi:hypothetical protein
MHEKFVKIIIFDNEVEARHMEAILKERNIPHLIRSYHDLVYDGLYQTQKGWGHLEAPEKYRDEIEEICDDLTSNSNVSDGEDQD